MHWDYISQQIEARERLIKELENQARTRMESVEIEGTIGSCR